MAKRGGSLGRYVLLRILLTVPMVLILLTFVFVILRVAPGDPIEAAYGQKLPPAEIAKVRHNLGLDRPLIVQYGAYLGDMVHGDFGKSVVTQQSVGTLIRADFPATLELTLTAMLVAIVVGVGIGSLSGRFRDTPIDLGGRLFGIVIYAAPIFWLGMMFQLLFSVKLHIFPSGGRTAAFAQPHHITGLYLLDSVLTWNWSAFWQTLRYLALPAITLGLVIGGVLVRLVRVHMLQTLQSDYVEAARARGIPEWRVVMRHAFRNALIPVITVTGLQFAALLGGAVLTETTFTWPGLGSQLVQYLDSRDYPGVQGIITFFAILVVFVSLLIDVINAYVDPRIRY
ncbi:MAG: ABC transporter permease [Actinobacteria bacterium]|nr:MAG: ABC transporter permease [Actinomycetota bacterium]